MTSEQDDLEIANFRYAELIEGLKLIASPFDTQKNSLPDYVHIPDEILNAVPSDSWDYLYLHGFLTKEQLAKLWEFDELLNSINGPENYDDLLEFFRNDDEIHGMRKYAKNLLALLGKEWSTPDLSHNQWVKSN